MYHINAVAKAHGGAPHAGRKRWRVVSNSNFTAHRKLLKAHGGMEVGGKLLLADVAGPFETWEAETSPLASEDVAVHEGVLGPGEMLYIPGNTTVNPNLCTMSYSINPNA